MTLTDFFSCIKCSFFLFTASILMSCSDSEEENPSLELSTYTVNQLYKVNSMANMSQELWPDYDYMSAVPIYYILQENEEIHGYILNPPAPSPQESNPVNAYADQTLEIVQNDSLLAGAMEALGKLGRFDFSYFHEENTLYYLTGPVMIIFMISTKIRMTTGGRLFLHINYFINTSLKTGRIAMNGFRIWTTILSIMS